MRRLRRLAVFGAFVLSCLCVTGCSSKSTTGAANTLEDLKAELQHIVQRADGTVGVAVVHIKSGAQVMINGDEPFPMGSMFKFPVAVQLLHRVVEGEVTLDTMLPFTPHNRHPGSGYIAKIFRHRGVDISLLNYLDLMMVQSDNSAADIVLEAAGGPKAVTMFLSQLGLDGIRVDRNTIELLSAINGLREIGSDPVPDSDVFFELLNQTTASSRAQAQEAFEKDFRDTATPADMAELLRLVWTQEILNAETCQLLINMMAHCATGERRIRAGVPEGVVVANKSGTVGRSANDIGVVTLPEGKGHVVVVVFIKESDATVEDREAVIADIAANAYAFFAGR